ncbi:hypothetical protein ABK040_011861 [Willaertia magna]
MQQHSILEILKDHQVNDFIHYHFLLDFFSVNELSNTFLLLNSTIAKNLLGNEYFWEKKCDQYFHTLNSLRLELNRYESWNDKKALQLESLCKGKELRNISKVVVDDVNYWNRDLLERESKNQWIIIKCLYLLENVNYISKLKFFKKIKFSKNFLTFRFFTILFKTTTRYPQYIYYCFKYELPNNFNISKYFPLVFIDEESSYKTNEMKKEIILQHQYFFTNNFLQLTKKKLKLATEMLMHCFANTCFPNYFLYFLTYGYHTNLEDSYDKVWDKRETRKELFEKEKLFLLSTIDFSLDKGYRLKYVQLCPCVSIEEKEEKDNKLIVKLYEEYHGHGNECYEYIYPNDISKIVKHLDNFFSRMCYYNIGKPIFARDTPKVGVMSYILAFSRIGFQENLSGRYQISQYLNEHSYFKNETVIYDIYQSLTIQVNDSITKCANKIKKNVLRLIEERLTEENNKFNLREFCNQINLNYPKKKEMERFILESNTFKSILLLYDDNRQKSFKNIRNEIWKNYLMDLEKVEEDDYKEGVSDYAYLQITIHKCIVKYLNLYIYSQPNVIELVPNGKVSKCYNRHSPGILQCFRLLLLSSIAKLVNFVMLSELATSNVDIFELAEIEKEIAEKMKQINFEM